MGLEDTKEFKRSRLVSFREEKVKADVSGLLT